MPGDRKIIVFEANEIPFSVVDHYVARKPASHVARLVRQAKQFETVCEDQVELDPWISWPTLHRGVIDERHQIFHLGQSLEKANESYPPIWDLLSKHGVRVGMMGSLHTSTPPENVRDYAFYVPDFFADVAFAHPDSLTPFQAFNLAMTRKSTRNVDGKIPFRAALKFLAAYVRQGMSLSTVRSIVTTLLKERRSLHLKTRRRALQPLISLDIFLHFLKRTKPGYAALHANHVAAAMHRYWAAAFPQDVPTNKMSAEWMEKYQGEVEYAMDVFDTMIGKLLAFVDADPSYKLLLATSLGQAGVETVPTEGFVTITNVERFMHALGAARETWTQRFTMAPQIAVVFDSAANADAFERNLLQISVGEQRVVASKHEAPPLGYDRHGNSFQLYFYFEAYAGPQVARVAERELSFEELGWGFRPHEDGVACSARHTPFGILMVYDPKCAAVDPSRTRISTLDIVPAILESFGAPQPSYMKRADPTLLDPAVAGAREPMPVVDGGVERVVARAV